MAINKTKNKNANNKKSFLIDVYQLTSRKLISTR